MTEHKKMFSFQWHLTDECNLDCSHCYRDQERQQPLPFAEAKERIVDQIIEAAPKMKGEAFLALSGGEPLLYPDFFPLLDYLQQRSADGQGISVILVTNGTLLDDRMVARLSSYRSLLSDVQVSLDGATPEVHDAIRGPGSFDRSLAGLRRIIEGTQLHTTVSYTFHRGNAADLPRMLDLGRDLGVSMLYITRLVPIGRGAGLADLSMSPDEVREVLTLLHDRQEHWNEQRARGQQRPLVVEDQALFHLTDPEQAVARCTEGTGGLGNACAIASATLTILADGTVLPCRRLPIPLGNLRRQSLLEIWFGSDLLWQFRQRQRHMQGKCQECEYLHSYPQLCSGGAPCIAYGTCGDFNQPDPHCWYEPALQNQEVSPESTPEPKEEALNPQNPQERNVR